MERYELGEIIGRGSSGVVRQAVDRKKDKNVAIKMITVSDSVIGKQLTREMNLLMELKHPNIISAELVLVSKKEIWIVMDCYPQTLLSLIRQPNTLTADRIKRYLRQILEGVAYCHSLGVLHRDLKPANILIDEASDSIKITDFGIARPISSSKSRQQLSPKCGTFSYMAPEILLGKKYGLAADMWSIGCIFAELVTNKPLLKSSTSQEMVDQIFRVFFEVTPRPRSWDNRVDGLPAKDFDAVAPTLDALGQDLLSCLLRIDPALRLTAEQAVKHPYVLTAQEAHKHAS